jgi:uncharacterized membrane protein YcjF (UPF0283 family)
MIRTKWNKTNHQFFITVILTGMVIYSNVMDVKREWTTMIVLSAFTVMRAHPKDFLDKESGNSPVSLWQ